MDLFAYNNFTLAKELAGQQRALGADGFAKGFFTKEGLNKFILLSNRQDAYIDVFLSHADTEEISLYNEMLKREYMNEVLRIKDIVFQNAGNALLENIDASYWYNIMTKKINALKGVEDLISSNLQKQVSQIVQQAGVQKHTTFAILMALLAIMTLVSFLFIRSINYSVNKVFDSILKLGRGEYDIVLPVARDNELGKLAKALNILRENGIEQYKLKIELEEHKDKLLEEVDRQTADLKELNAELEEFTYRTSHDLKSPVVSAVKLLEISKKNISEKQPEKAFKALSLAESGLRKLTNLIEDILTIARGKKLTEDNSEINLAEIIDNSKEKFSHMEGYSNINWIIELKHRHQFVSKSTRVVMLVENLISNAIKYQDYSRKDSFIKITTSSADDKLLLEVEDNGLGIPETHHKKLFSMFERFHPKVSFGSGLGLYLMKKSVDVLGGKIEFQDKEKGAIFRVIAPIKGEG